jgi:hypothetical protein
MSAVTARVLAASKPACWWRMQHLNDSDPSQVRAISRLQDLLVCGTRLSVVSFALRFKHLVFTLFDFPTPILLFKLLLDEVGDTSTSIHIP